MRSLVTADEAAPALGVSRSTLFALAAAREVPHYRIGRSVRFDLEELLAHVRHASGEADPPGERARGRPVDGLSEIHNAAPGKSDEGGSRRGA